MSHTARVCKALKTLPLLGLTLLLSWVLYPAWIGIGVFYLAVERGRLALFALHSIVFFFFWTLTVLSLVVTVQRGPGYVARGDTEDSRPMKQEQEVSTTRSSTPQQAPLRSRRVSNASSYDHDSGVGDVERLEDQVALLKAVEDLPLDQLAQKAAEAVGFDAAEAHERTIELSEDKLLTAKADGTVRFCRKCQAVKPDRAHHCSICGQCVLQMDHHCPWIATCVAHRNRKAFVLFLTCGTALAWYCASASLLALMSWTDAHALKYDYAPLSWAFLLLIGAVFGIVLSGFTGYHWWLVCHNRTTLENMESSNRVRFTAANDINEQYRSDFALTRQERKRLARAAAKLNIFDLGIHENVANVFGPPRNGTSPYGLMGWLMPSGPVRGDGRSWPINERHRTELERISREIRKWDTGEPVSASSSSSAMPSATSTSTAESV